MLLLLFFSLKSIHKNEMLDTSVNNYNNNNNRKERWVDVGAHVEWLQLLTPIEPHINTQEDRIDRVKKKKRKRKKRRRKIIIKYNKHSSSTTATYMKGRDATNGKSLDGVESLHRLVKLNQWIVDLKLLPRRSCSFPNATPWGWQNEVSRLGVGRRNGRSLGTHTNIFIFFFTFDFCFFFFIFFFPVRGLRCCNLGTRRLMAGQSPLDVASVRFLTHVTLSPVTFRLFIHQRPLRRNPRPFIDDVYLLGRFISLSLCVCVFVCVRFSRFETSTRQQLRNFFLFKITKNQNFKCRLLTQKNIPFARQFLNWICFVFIFCVDIFFDRRKTRKKQQKKKKTEIKRREFRIRRER